MTRREWGLGALVPSAVAGVVATIGVNRLLGIVGPGFAAAGRLRAAGQSSMRWNSRNSSKSSVNRWRPAEGTNT